MWEYPSKTGGSTTDGPRFALLLRSKLKQRGWTYGELADRVSDIYPAGVSEDRIKDLFSLSTPFRLPKRDRREYNAFEAVISTLDIDLTEALETFSDAELDASIYAPYLQEIAQRRQLRVTFAGKPTLQGFIHHLPETEPELFALRGITRLSNAPAFAYLFALERLFSGLEMLVSHQPPLIFFDDEDVERLVRGMELDEADADTFRQHFRGYRSHFRSLALSSAKRYRVVLMREPFQRFLRSKRREAARALLSDMLSFLSLPNFEMVLVERANDPEELEVICKHHGVPADLSDTLAVVIRRTPIDHDRFEYVLVPMPQLAVSLQRDRNAIDEMWAVGIDQARLAAGALGLDHASPVSIKAATKASLLQFCENFM